MDFVSLRPYRLAGTHGEQAVDGVFAPEVPDGVDGLMVQSLAANIRYRLDGVAPDADTGFQLKDGNPPVILPIGDNTVPKFIKESGSPILQYQWMRQS